MATKPVNRRDDDEEAADEGLQDVPIRTPHIQVVLLALVHEPERDKLGGDAARCGDQHRRRGQFDGLHEAHRAHPQHVESHGDEEEAVEEGPQDLRPNVAEGARGAGFSLTQTHGDQRNEHAAHGREGVEGIRHDGDRASPDADPEFHDEVKAGKPARNDERFAITTRGHVAGMTAVRH
jgi:hypothetical protein